MLSQAVHGSCVTIPLNTTLLLFGKRGMMYTSNYNGPASSTLFHSPQVKLFANIYLTVVVTGKTSQSNQLEILWLSPSLVESYFCTCGHLYIRERGKAGRKLVLKIEQSSRLSLQSSWKILAFYYSCSMLTPSPLPREHAKDLYSTLASSRQLLGLASVEMFPFPPTCHI